MDIGLALEQVDRSVILAGNLDPSAVFHGGTPDEVREKTMELLQRTAIYRNFIISSGCDIPPHTPVENLDAFYQTVRGYTA